MHRRSLWAALAVALLVFSSNPLRGADEKGEGDHGHAPKYDKKKVEAVLKKADKNNDGQISHDEFDTVLGELHTAIAKVEKKDEPIDLFKGWIDLSVYTIIVFLILFVILRAFAWGPISEGLNKRERSIAQAHRDADSARSEAQRTQAELESQRKRADEDVRMKLEKARADAEALAAERESQGKATLAAERERQRRELQIERDQALAEIWQQGARLATVISGRAIKKQLSYEDHHALLNEALDEFRASASARKHDIESATS